MDVCKEVAIGQWIVDDEMVFQLRGGVDGPSLCYTIDILTDFGTFCARELEDSNIVVMMIHSGTNIGGLDVHC